MFILNEMEIKITRFPDNTIKFDIPKDTVRSCNKLQWNFESMEELFVLIGVSEKLKSTSTTLFIPYLPNARMDKIYDKMEGFMLKYFVESVDSLGFKTVIILDPHSDIYKQFVRKSTWIESRMLQSFISRTIEKVKVMNNSEELVIVYPDKGARNRYSKLTKIESDLYGEKVRNQETGEIISFDLIGEVPSDEIPVLIVDDISSLGGTFYFTAKKT